MTEKRKAFSEKMCGNFHPASAILVRKEGSTMEHVDKQMERRVWQRVQSREAAPTPLPRQENLKPWVLVSQENTAVFRTLQLQLIGKQWEGLRRLETESGRMTHALRGLSGLLGETVKLNPVPTPKELPRRALEKSFHRTRRLRDEMEKRAADPEYGVAYRSLTRKAEDLCAAIAEMLGKLEA
jgi:hypothetical protein